MRPIYFIKRVIIFLFFSFLIYILGIIVYGEFFPHYFQKNIFYEKFAYGFSNTRFKEVKQTKNIDILFLGSSRSYRHYDPRIFNEAGYSSFNLGSSSQTFLQTELLVNRYLNSLNPKYVVLDVYPGMFSSDGVETSLDLISNDYNSWDTLYLAFQTRSMMVLNTWFYALYKEYLWNSLNEKEKKVNGLNHYIPGGYVQREVSTNYKKGGLKQAWKFDEMQWDSFTSIVEKISKTSAKLFVVHSPRNSSYKYKGGDKLKRYLESQNLNYYDYQISEFWNDSTHFYDPSHMNQNGVEIFNDLIIKDLFK